MAGIEPGTVEEFALPPRADYCILEFVSEDKENKVWCGKVIHSILLKLFYNIT
jgi:hypothetical protein